MTTTTLCTIPEARSASARASYSTVATAKPAGWHAALASDQMFVRHNGTDQPGGPGGSS
jgi:hypothetical protein